MLEWFKTMDSLTLAPAPTDTFFPMKKRKIIIGIMHYPILAPLLQHVENPLYCNVMNFRILNSSKNQGNISRRINNLTKISQYFKHKLVLHL